MTELMKLSEIDHQIEDAFTTQNIIKGVWVYNALRIPLSVTIVKRRKGHYINIQS